MIDPGISWKKDGCITIDSDTELDSQSVLSPKVIKLDRYSYRLYYSGSKKITSKGISKGYILSAISNDLLTWKKEHGIRLHKNQSPETKKLVSPDSNRLLESTLKDHFDHWLTGNTISANKLIEFFLSNAEERIREKNEKVQIIRVFAQQGETLGRANPSNKPEF